MRAALETLLKLSLSPLLIWQGLGVRKHALILPEASGERSGCVGTGTPLRVLVLGDSSAAGVGVETQEQALSGQLARALSADYALEWRLVAKTGATTASTLERVKRLHAETFDVVVLAIGVNDVTRSVPLRRWLAMHDTLLKLLHTKFGAKRVYTTALPPMGRFPVLPQPLRHVIGLTASRYDVAMAGFLANRPDVTRLQLDLPLDPTLMASDGFHPGAEVYRIWADHVAAAIRSDFPPEALKTAIAQETGGI
ncbi:SGNH/GDSL hydrolase family protein [Neptunicoccus cionae]|uniref:Lipase n=1 Tax=Neptunicoccus cionae TaxID=2035344 RepID=A0A916QVN3_9RHOB|nr:SGNH/GDSL hydrolase family protein [Amylibacter cionae]GGA15166.1 lipase [Amylibacter cionae]